MLFFGGDALFAWFGGANHEWRAARAAADVVGLVADSPQLDLPDGSTRLGVSVGLHAGTATGVVGGRSQRSFFLSGPGVDGALAMESAAGAQQILAGASVARALRPAWVRPHGDVFEISRRVAEPPDPDPPPPSRVGATESELFLPEPLRPLLVADQAPREHRLASIVFARLGGLRRLSPSGRVAALQRWACELEEVAAATGTTLMATDVKARAAVAIVMAGMPVVSPRDEERAVAAAHELVARNPAVSAGVNTGTVFASDLGHPTRRTYMVLGDSVNTAARTMGAARPGEALVTDSVVRSAGVRTVGRPRSIQAKGKREPLILRRIADGGVDRSSSVRTPLVGRDREFSLLRAAVDAPAGASIELIGEGGSGRSRLLAELTRRSRRTPAVHVAVPASIGGVPFAAVHEAFRALTGVHDERQLAAVSRRMSPELRSRIGVLRPVLGLATDASDADAEAEAVSHEAVVGARVGILSALARRDGLWTVDDADALDPASAALLRALTPILVRAGWVVVASRRPGNRVLDPPAATVRLGPLPASAVRTIIRANLVAPCSERRLRELVAASFGIPLFASELADSVDADIRLPRSAERVGGALVDTLAPRDRALLRCAAVLGDAVELELLGSVVDDAAAADPRRWDALRRFVHVDGGRLHFTNETIRDAAYEGLSFRDRRRLHGRAVEALEAAVAAGTPVSAATIARHADRAGDAIAVARWAPAAAEEAERAGAMDDAADLWRLALDAAVRSPSGDADVRRFAESCGDANEIIGEPAMAQSAYRTAMAHGAPTDRARLHWKVGRLHLRTGDLAAAKRAAARGLRELRGSGEPEGGPLGIRLLLLRAAAHCFGDARDASLRDGLTAASAAFALGDDELIADAAIHLQMEYGERGDAREAEYGRLAVSLLERRGPSVELGSALLGLGLDRMFAGDWRASIDLYDRAARTFDICGHVVGRLSTEINRLSILVEQGRLAEAIELIDDLGPAATVAPPWFAAFLLATRGRARSFDGDPDEGARAIRHALRTLRTEAPDRLVADTECYLLEALVLGRHPAAAVRLAGPLIDRLERLAPGQVVGVTARRLLALARAQAGRGDLRAELEEVLGLARDRGASIEVARTLAALDLVVRHAGATPPARWERERRRILREHAVVFEPDYPFTPAAPATPAAPTAPARARARSSVAERTPDVSASRR